MMNPDSLNVGEPGCKENLEHQHPNRPSLHRASDLDHDCAWWRAEARGVGTDWPALLALHLGIFAPLAAVTRCSPACDTCGADPCINPSFCNQCRRAHARLRQERRSGPAESIPQDWDRKGAWLASPGFDEHQICKGVRGRRALLGAGRYRRNEVDQALDNLRC